MRERNNKSKELSSSYFDSEVARARNTQNASLYLIMNPGGGARVIREREREKQSQLMKEVEKEREREGYIRKLPRAFYFFYKD